MHTNKNPTHPYNIGVPYKLIKLSAITNPVRRWNTQHQEKNRTFDQILHGGISDEYVVFYDTEVGCTGEQNSVEYKGLQ